MLVSLSGTWRTGNLNGPGVINVKVQSSRLLVEMWTSDQNKSHGVLIFESSKRWICNHIRQVESEREFCQYTPLQSGANRESLKGIQPRGQLYLIEGVAHGRVEHLPWRQRSGLDMVAVSMVAATTVAAAEACRGRWYLCWTLRWRRAERLKRLFRHVYKRECKGGVERGEFTFFHHRHCPSSVQRLQTGVEGMLCHPIGLDFDLNGARGSSVASSMAAVTASEVAHAHYDHSTDL